jgi:putative sigma-54 modulation protein
MSHRLRHREPMPPQEASMDLIVKGRGVRLTDAMRRTAEAKLAKLTRIDPQVTGFEVEIVLEHNPRINEGHRVEVVCLRRRGAVRASASGQDLEGALDQVIERLERQLISQKGKLRDRRQARPIA